ncbi:NmrA family transcriptional regulator [Streptomyces sp. CNQ-509]|uniref:SDR family oxidoreductase n=1 Tax=Streptomyces sp. CNQ-509 TaxID=444103 RepID=UPI00062DF639|nr:NAD(P)H-binding protein [Streptomyces sp. CNQ-509]AKH83166.1 NmrA family transcriptional regulator [Streptomyces sp. CNQ-509]
MTSAILLTGGTGTLGRLVAPRLLASGATLRILSRQPQPAGAAAGGAPGEGVEYVTGDLTTGEGAAAAVAGADVIVHCAGTSKGDDVKTRHLVDAAAAAGNAHLVYISVVGADRTPVVSGLDRAMFGYVAAKRASEEIVAGSGLPWTTLRATQFHELTLTTARALARMPVLPAPSGFRIQPIAAVEVAGRLAELALAEPAGLVAEMGGPRTYDMKDLLRGYLKATGRRRPVMPMRIPGKAAAAFRAGANLTPGHAVGQQTWEEFLAATAVG